MNFSHFVDFSSKLVHNIQKMNNFLGGDCHGESQ